jgi:hypothetical protein
MCGGLLVLSGCTMIKTKHTSTELDRIVLDQQLLEAAHSIQTTQAELRSLVGIQVGAEHSAGADLAGIKTSKPITIQWQGDAAQLLHVIATDQGLQLVHRGIPAPMPVSINATQLPLSAVITLLRAQLDNRASVYTQDGMLVIDYNPALGVFH